MKLSNILWILLLLVFTDAQANFSLTAMLPPGMQGNVQLVIDKTFLNRNPEISTYTITNGRFDIKANIERSYIVELLSPYFRFPLYVEPGDELSLDLTGESKDIVAALSGRGSENNKFLQAFFTGFAEDFNDSLQEIQMTKMSIDAFESVLFSKRKEHKNFIAAYEKRSGLSENFQAFIVDEVNYHYWRELFAFPIVNANKDAKNLKVAPIPSIMLENFNQVIVSNEATMISASYRDFVKYYVTYSASKSNGFNKFTDPALSADRKSSVAKELLSNKIYSYWLSRFTIEECTRLTAFTVRKLLSSLKEVDSSKMYFPLVSGYCNDDMIGTALNKDSKQEAGKASFPDPGLLDINMKPVSLSSLKGKVVYIDFWASWCGPCRVTMPYSKQMHDNLTEQQKKEIAFLYISIDGDTAAWKRGIRDLQIEGINWISPGNWSSKAAKYFQLNSIPRYMIMNKKGEIVNINARRPSEPSVLDELIRLTKE